MGPLLVTRRRLERAFSEDDLPWQAFFGAGAFGTAFAGLALALAALAGLL